MVRVQLSRVSKHSILGVGCVRSVGEKEKEKGKGSVHDLGLYTLIPVQLSTVGYMHGTGIE